MKEIHRFLLCALIAVVTLAGCSDNIAVHPDCGASTDGFTIATGGSTSNQAEPVPTVEIEPEETTSPTETVPGATTGEPPITEAASAVPVEGCLVRKNCTDAQWAEIVSLWQMIPSELRTAFDSSGWVMVCTSEDFWTAENVSKCAGLTVIGSKKCYVRSDNSRLPVTVAHEFGHWLDYANGWVSSTDEFTALYNSERWNFVGYMEVGDGHYTSTSKEYFAQVFCQLLVAPWTADSALGSFAYVERFLQ